ncbi:MAG: hypothetical protein O2955_17515 [Planctomycetota bacterium]|nr:hypothetical protein [Planctomycetota bacterium]MDA1214310.1 hypothetical protein [Planctomycetota bacterium]
MNLHIKRQLRVCVLTVAVVGGLTTTSQAGIIPWLYDAIFGPPGSLMYGANYGYGATYGTAYRGYYSPYAYGYGAGYAYAPAANTGCNSCGTSTATFYGPTNTCCATNNCNVPSQSQTTTNRTPTPATTEPQPDPTFSESAEEEDDGFRKRETGSEVPPTSTKAFKIPENGDVIQQRPTPGAEEAVEEEKTDEPQAEQLRVPTLNLDTAKTTHPVVAHHRTEWHARFVTPTIARKMRPINADWIPVSTATQIAGK